MFGGVRHRKRARVTAVHPRVFAAAEEALRAAPAAKRQRLREAPTLDALPDGCLFEVLRRVQGARVRDANKRTALHFAAREGRTEVSQFLVEQLRLPVDPKDDDCCCRR
uniref:Predicted protein n=1 Tax=Hordeum vulgare subsp. vulgare TaxID=112509 RepID=F2E2U4_HORVV|nr:predicted protein [Hordeum vulgare subsp. vulgare]